MNDYNHKLKLYVKSAYFQGKSKVQGFDNFNPPEDAISMQSVFVETQEAKRCFRDLSLFEYCINPLKNISLKEYEKCIKKLSWGQEAISIRQL